ncbi:hypothetical protein ABG768_025733 [Culter alburnus]|uniref:Uncharacterized protein n=1 Tax=Culter alburnus TaxID=194366 RepID=A0AAW2AFK9_CULAL
MGERTGFVQVLFSHTLHKPEEQQKKIQKSFIMQCPQSPARILSEEQFSCSICLEVFVEPVSTPCGHTFCKACLQGFWNHSKKFLCPMCKKAFSRKPELSVNCVLAEIAEQFQGLSTLSSNGSDKGNVEFAHSPSTQKEDDWGDFAKAGDVPCDACIGRKMKAKKSCLNCPGSFCEAHLRHHKKGKAMTSHKLVEPIHNLEDKMCKVHKRLLDAYCRNEHVCVCKECAESSHKAHDVVSTEREWKKKTTQLGKKRSELKHLIKEREKKLEEIKQSIKVLKENSQKEIEESWAVYAELQRLLEQSQAELLELITTRQKQVEQQAKDLASGLEHELNTLRKRSSELDALAQTQDKVVFLQFLPSLPPPPEPSDWSSVSVNTDQYLSTIRKSVCSLVDKFQQEVKRLYGKELRKLQNYASEVILDSATAQRDLCISEDGRQTRTVIVVSVIQLQHTAGMASPTSMLAEEQVHCSICLDVFTNPVSIPCGHNFCMACIGSYWKSSALFMCPMCKKTFFKQPDISINTVLREISEKFKEMKTNPVVNLQKTTQLKPGPSPEELPTEMPELIPPNGPWAQEVSCDVCTGPQRQAVKSCLVCLTSYCEEHLKTHTARFTKHKLIEPVQNLEDRMCRKHERLLELFCKKDQTIVCVLCTEMDHRAHYTVPVEREWAEKKALLRKTEAEVQQMIQERLKKVDDFKHSIELNKSSAQREIEDSIQVFSDLIRAVQKVQAELVLDIEEKQKKTESWANGHIQELEQEIDVLKLRNTQLEYLSQTEDHIHFLQNFTSLMAHPHTKDWSETCVHADQCVGTTRRAVLKLEETLTEEVEKLAEMELRRVQKYSVDVTFDPDTANPWLQLSEDRCQMRHLGAWQDLPDTPERFDTVVIALGREGLSSGRRYWEVQVGEKDDWYLGVARASVNRKGRISVSTAHGYWAIAMKKGQEYRVSSSPPLLLSIEPKLKRVGIYVDYEEGQVSFYDVQNKSHIYTFMDSFKEKLFPFFYLYCSDKASDTMMICPVQETSHTKQC